MVYSMESIISTRTTNGACEFVVADKANSQRCVGGSGGRKLGRWQYITAL